MCLFPVSSGAPQKRQSFDEDAIFSIFFLKKKFKSSQITVTEFVLQDAERIKILK